MHKLILIVILLVAPAIALGQNQTRERRSSDAEAKATPEARERVVSGRVLNHADNQKAVISGVPTSQPSTPTNTPAWGDSLVTVRPTESRNPNTQVSPSATAGNATQQRHLVQPTALALPKPPDATSSSNSVRGAAASFYAVGIGDVLDVRLPNLATRESTLFTVMKDGTLEYPLVGNAVRVVGLTTDAIAKLISDQIKVLNSPRVSVSVRDYASHSVVVTGAVGNPGRKILRLEAVPLFAILAESLVRPEATVATVTHSGKDGLPINLKDEKAMATLVVSGDTIKISGGPSLTPNKFVYVSGSVAAPGEKMFRDGMTLTQALIAAGGSQHSPKIVVKISRQNEKGFLVSSEYELNAIEGGKAPDPRLQAGDRIEVTQKM